MSPIPPLSGFRRCQGISGHPANGPELHIVKLVKSHTDRAAISGLLKAGFRNVYGGLVLVPIALDDQAVIGRLISG